MTTLDTSKTYILTNLFTLNSKQLASDGDRILMDSVSTNDNSQWYLTSTTFTPYFRLHTVANGDSRSLDVVNDNGTSSTGLHFAATGPYTGQFWRLDSWGDGTYRLSNNFTGEQMHLDTYSDTLQLFLASGDYTGQHWRFGRVDTKATTSSAQASGVLTSSPINPSTTSTVSPPRTSSAPSENGSLSTGTIIGIAIAGLGILILCVGGALFFLKSQRKKKLSATMAGVSAPPDYTTATEKRQPVFAHVSPYHTQEPGDKRTASSYPVEVQGSVVQNPIEMPASRF